MYIDFCEVITIRGIYKDVATLRQDLEEWELAVLEAFGAKMTDKENPFPCIPATIGNKTNQLRYGYIGYPRSNTTTVELVQLMKNFTNEAIMYGPNTSLIVFYEITDNMKEDYTVEVYEQLFWRQLAGLSVCDEMDWPKNISYNPHHPLWEFCFNGEKFSMYCATPAHKNRKSRHFETMMLAITPRSVLEEFGRSESFASNIKKQVRKRMEKYDSIEIHPDLNSYGSEDNFEWTKCPFHQFLNLFKQ
ncbi:YqcI/YcgG family protein [Bacillus alkalisoli]|uniref:YqcI/YcgG family protein n=1 Tax=Bacillus alkalisoli TaxID=2011008 RepID=UPI000C25171D|nr:YqcI/YcgG family protein [Bacillus alkalisoli]